MRGLLWLIWTLGPLRAADCPTQTWYSSAFAKELGATEASERVCARQCPYPLGRFWEEEGGARIRVCGRCPLSTPFVRRADRECVSSAECGFRSAFLLDEEPPAETPADLESSEALYAKIAKTGTTICESAAEREFQAVMPNGEQDQGRTANGTKYWATTTVGDETRALFMTANQVFYRQENNSQRFVRATVNTTKFHPITGVYPALHDFILTTQDGYAIYDWERDDAGNITYCHVEAVAGDSRTLVLAVDGLRRRGVGVVHAGQQIIYTGWCNGSYCGNSGNDRGANVYYYQ